ncbi:class I SAM-dependent methyltransferase [Mycolicibacterium monacense]|uniref:class I SAM-dependent methyltransferase n=1 Tax=Mycolicibacterium monacense TaxID=85693 RepID=UPI0007EBEA9C|nr:class I SAM-dependent methyltransferase [Mycolicibacterium monacense]OBB60257.1 phosphatidylethanolamine N-methyltransferase [Mycolicibacterium monacense]OBF57604.1 phosphatidylethanolamine N-methyltransferase [Mycolicibacterium monacense]
MSADVDNPFFARLWTVMSGHETEEMRRLRAANLAGLTGRVLEIGAGTGTNFAHYPPSVTEVVAIEPERRLAAHAREAAAHAPVPVTVTMDSVEDFSTAEPFDGVVCSLVLCSVDDPDGVLRELFSLLRPGGELRYLEHIAETGARARLQKVADATVWPRMLGNCHTHRHTETAITVAGFRVEDARRERMFPPWVPLPVSELAVGRAVRPA